MSDHEEQVRRAIETRDAAVAILEAEVAQQQTRALRRQEGWQLIEAEAPRRADWSMLPQFDEPGFSGTGRPVPYTGVADRIDGAMPPVFETEFDLACIRARGRELAAFTAVSIGALDN